MVRRINRVAMVQPRAATKHASILLAIVLGMAAAAGTAMAMNARIGGIYVLASPKRAVPAAVLRSPYVDGVALRYYWDDLEPGRNVHDWSRVDSDIAAARANGKRVSLSVTAGVRTPGWVFTSGARAFPFIWDKPWGGMRKCSQVKLPIPWDPVFLASWRDFVRDLGRRYGSNDSVVMVKITGLNTASSETNLPHARANLIGGVPGPCAVPDYVSEWRTAGYSRIKIQQSWMASADAFADAFPRAALVAMITPGGFPRMEPGARGQRGGDTTLSRDLLMLGAARYGTRFIVQNNGLSSFWAWKKPYFLGPGVALGYQMLWSATGDSRCRMNHHRSPCDPATVLKAAITRGLNNGPAYLEIYPADVMNPSLQNVLSYAQSSLPHQSGASQRSAARYFAPTGLPAVQPPQSEHLTVRP